MATVKVVDLINRALATLQDPNGVRWKKLEMLDYLNAAQRAVVEIRPDAKVVTDQFDCSAESKQSLPEGALRLLDVVRNVSGKSIRQVDRQVLDNLLPNWHEYPPAGTTIIEHYVYSPLDPKTFYLFPKPTDAAQVVITYSSVPATVTSAQEDLSDITATVIGLDDIFANAILEYMLFRAYVKDADFVPSQQKAAIHMQNFTQSLGAKTQVDMVVTPKAEPVKPA